MDDLSIFMFSFSYLFALLFEMSLPCYFGNEIILKSDALSYCIFSSDWTGQDLQYKKKMIIFTERLKRPIQISAGKIILMSLTTFTSVMNAIYCSYRPGAKVFFNVSRF